MNIEEYWDEFINKFDSFYKKAEELGIQRRLVDDLVIEAYKIEVMKKYNMSHAIP
ncbi:MAG: hypothetical protein WBL93_07680 [Lutisporaceae bacterium]